MSIKLLICDDHQVIRTGLANLLAGTDIEIVGEADNGKETLRLAQKLKPDVILLDVRMPDGDGLETLEKLRAKSPECRVVMLSTYDNPTYIARPLPWAPAITCSRARRATTSWPRSSRWRRAIRPAARAS